MKRPTSVTVIAYLLIVFTCIGLLSLAAGMHNPQVQAMMATSPLSVGFQYVLGCLGLAINLVVGFSLLKGRNWARWLYVGWGLLSVVIGLATSPAKLMLLPGLVVFAIFVFFLFRAKANAYFVPAVSESDATVI